VGRQDVVHRLVREARGARRLAKEDDAVVRELALEEGPGLVERGNVRRREEDERRARVVDLVRELGGRVPRVRGAERHARGHARVRADDPLEAVEAPDARDVEALRHLAAEGRAAERGGEAQRKRLELAARERAPRLAVDEGGEILVERRERRDPRRLGEEVLEDVLLREEGGRVGRVVDDGRHVRGLDGGPAGLWHW
jgi:hypothetical protein